MSDINITFSRALLKSSIADVKTFFPDIKVSEAAVLQMAGGGTNKWWLFEYMHQGERFAHECHADNAYEARAKGWNAFVEKFKQAADEPVEQPADPLELLKAEAREEAGVDEDALATVLKAARSYLEDLESGVDDGTYDMEGNADAIAELKAAIAELS